MGTLEFGYGIIALGGAGGADFLIDYLFHVLLYMKVYSGCF